MKKNLSILLILALTSMPIGGGFICFAETQTKSQVETKYKHAKDQVRKLKLQERLETNKLYTNQKKLEKTETSLTTNKLQYERTKVELEKLQNDLAREIREYSIYQNATNKRIVQIFKSKRSGYVEFLLSSGDLNDFLDRVYYENIIMQIDKKTMEEAKIRAASIKNLKQNMESKKEYLAQSIKTMDKQQKTIQEAIRQNEKMIYKLQNDRATWEKSEKELARQSAQLTSFIKNTTNSKTQTSSSIPKTTGGFIRPVSGPVTSTYGTRLHPIFKKYITHTGVDLGMPIGAQVKAANSGKVIYVGWYGGYGKVVIIDHGKVNGIPVTTLYAHLSSYGVSNGANVTKGQVIGNVGTTGYATGPHLHYEVRENGQHVNPAKYSPI